MPNKSSETGAMDSRAAQTAELWGAKKVIYYCPHCEQRPSSASEDEVIVA